MAGATALAALLLGRSRVKRAARIRRRAERQARRAGAATSPAPDVTVPTASWHGSAAALANGDVEPAGEAEPAQPGDGALAAATLDVEAAEPGFRSIRGIGPAMEDRLRAAGVTSVAQVAAWSDADVEAIAPRIRVTPERVRSQGWVEQARSLMGGSPG
jgi:large subunit ribosomal protein L21